MYGQRQHSGKPSRRRHGRRTPLLEQEADYSVTSTAHDATRCSTPRRPDSSPSFDAAISSLTSKQRAHLRSLAHPLKPLVHVGKDGVTESTVRAAGEAFNTRELLKVRVLDAAPLDAGETARKLLDQIENAVLVQVIGHVFVLYRPFPDTPDIRLPA
ncbi:MAG: YhbY family RNA-binding protein [Rhodothermales bacterium]